MRSLLAASLLSTIALAGVTHAQRDIWASPTGDDTLGDGSDTNPFRTISRCVTAAAGSGDTIRLTAGTFGDDDQIHITGKSVTVRGDGVDQTIVRPHATLFFTLPGGLPPGVPQEHAVAVVADGPVTVSLYDLTLDNAYRVPASSGRAYNVMFLDGADGTVEGCELRGARDNPLAANDAPAAVMVRGDGSSDPCRVTVRRCHLHDFGKAGVLALYDSVVLLEENEVQGAGTLSSPPLAQIGLHLAFGATGDVRRNRVRDLELAGGAGVGVGIQLLDVEADVLLEGNRTIRCERGIESIQTGSTVRALTVRENFTTESDIGIFVDHDGAHMVGNTMHRSRLLDARDDTGTPTVNTWSDNSWAQWNGTGSKAIAGLAALADTTPRRGLDQLDAPVTVALGAVPVAVVAAEFDAGRLDFATVNAPALGATPTLAVGLQTAASVFTVASLTFATVDAQPTALVAGQFDGAAGLDLAAVTDESMFYVFANDGNGAFTLLHSGSLPAAVTNPWALSAGDVDGNGLDDLAVAALGGLGGPGGCVVLTASAGGTTWTPVSLPVTFTGQCKGVALARVDGDTNLDLVVSEGSGTAGVLHVLAGDGLGAFTALGSSPLPLSADPTSCAVDDVDRDGRADLLATCSNAAVPVLPGTLHVLLQQAGGSFVPHAYRTGRLPAHVVGLDLGGDADVDTPRHDVAFVSLGDNALGLLDGYEPLGFTANLAGIAGTSPRALASGDFDGDGQTDLVVADGGTQAALVLPARATARADLFGSGCPGEAGRQPFVAPYGVPALPRLPNPTFGVGLQGARPFAVAVLLSSTQAPSGGGSCVFLLPQIDLVWTAFTDVVGAAHVRLPVPASPTTLSGLELWFQWVVLDPEGRLGDFLATTEGLRLRVGG
ncbi:MAG: FG-GAP-like repeat-containing protein [Planctomycetota bacterium]